MRARPAGRPRGPAGHRGGRTARGRSYPVGANSRYEIAPLFYRLSGTFLAGTPELADWTIRINPMRAGADLVLTILADALREARCS